ncbi:MAG: DNA topoisomerase IV subunit A [Candidatus Portiera sp.]|nr:DNA topoisomerase IV subunit A [Portiera sp.]
MPPTLAAKLSKPPRKIEIRPLDEYVEKAYLNYSMYVILDRALPQLADGLKPVQRRIVYAMSELGLRSGAKYKKSARTIGDVIGKFHPHGDSACYEAMVLMAQSFATRYCLVDGQGNWGSVDDAKSFAAMRYTEARLTPYSQLLLTELNRDTTKWQPNFDGTMDEPSILPVQVPNVILNGSTGIAVGMTTEIPSHNLTEIMDACLLLLKKPELSSYINQDTSEEELLRGRSRAVKKLMTKVVAPDFASGGSIISPRQDIEDAYTKGVGNIKVRCHYNLQDKTSKGIVIDELPPQTSTHRIVEQIQQQMQNKKVPMLASLRDESDNENPVRLVLETRKGTDRERLMAHLFAATDLEKSIRININAISIEGKPRIWPLNELLHHWLEYRRDWVLKRLQNNLAKVEARLHILEGLLKIFLDLDEVIRIIRQEDEPKPKLIKKFKLSEIQAEAILETKLRHLAKLEEKKVRGEEEDLTDKKYYLQKTIKSKDALTDLIRKEFLKIKEEYGDVRRTRVLEDGSDVTVAETFNEAQLVSKEAVTLVLSRKGWVRLAKAKVNTKGQEVDPTSFSYRDGDGFLCSWHGFNNQAAVFFDNHGRAYSLPALSLPSARGLGDPLSSRLDLVDGSEIQAGLLVKEEDNLLLVSREGNGFIIKQQELLAMNRKRGKQVMNIKSGAGVVTPIVAPADIIENSAKYSICCLTVAKRLLILPAAGIPQMNKGKGIRFMNPAYPKDSIKQLLILDDKTKLAIIDKGETLVLNATAMRKYKANRGGKGKTLGKFSEDLQIAAYEEPSKVSDKDPSKEDLI